MMHLLTDLGVSFSMDDFGTGYSSLAMMRLLPLSQLKVDKFFVQRIGFSEKAESVIQGVIDLARKLDLQIVAEGIETQDQLDFLRKQGCQLYQGYLFGKPVPATMFDATLQTGPRRD